MPTLIQKVSQGFEQLTRLLKAHRQPTSPTLVWAGGVVNSIGYSDGSTITFTRVSGQLTTIDYARPGVATQRVSVTYANGQLATLQRTTLGQP